MRGHAKAGEVRLIEYGTAPTAWKDAAPPATCRSGSRRRRSRRRSSSTGPGGVPPLASASISRTRSAFTVPCRCWSRTGVALHAPALADEHATPLGGSPPAHRERLLVRPEDRVDQRHERPPFLVVAEAPVVHVHADRMVVRHIGEGRARRPPAVGAAVLEVGGEGVMHVRDHPGQALHPTHHFDPPTEIPVRRNEFLGSTGSVRRLSSSFSVS